MLMERLKIIRGEIYERPRKAACADVVAVMGKMMIVRVDNLFAL